MRDLDAVIFVEEPPDFTYVGGLFHIRQKISKDGVIERVMRPDVFFESIARAVECSRAHRPRGVVKMVPRDDHQAASGKPSK